MTDRIFAELKPDGLDELAEDGYRRRRSADLARAFATPRVRRRSRRPFLLVASAAAAGLAAATVVVASGGTPAPKTQSPAVAAKPATARSFLLAAASTALREPAESGRYWYLRERTFAKVHHVPGDYAAKLDALRKAQEDKEAGLKGAPERLAAAKKEFDRKVMELKTGGIAELPYAAFAADTRETWRPMKAGETGRSVSNQDVEVTFGSPQDEADWRAAGSPELAEKRPKTYDDDTERILSIDNPSLNLRNLGDLPTGEDALRRRLDDLWKRSPNSADTDKAGYLWQTAVDLMTAPLKPGTRAALFRVLADQPAVSLEGRTSDALGRTGVALSTPTAHELTVRLVVDEQSAELLQYELAEKGKLLLRVALEDMGWSDELGRRPAG
ncbi:CU044_5270 family protein [Nonomuraea angiospora]|uniref:CU044_5270 family protein n=1 Tax=Nonomuraea angiospora TaxID=46172 RepID=UPI0029AF81DE|nr:CU044_5270 family protein [Nonomuraea angiospora]MDX3104545.1 CU044_5270 family protein [Nonomuraea angiospora]